MVFSVVVVVVRVAGSFCVTEMQLEMNMELASARKQMRMDIIGAGVVCGLFVGRMRLPSNAGPEFDLNAHIFSPSGIDGYHAELTTCGIGIIQNSLIDDASSFSRRKHSVSASSCGLCSQELPVLSGCRRIPPESILGSRRPTASAACFPSLQNSHS